MEKRNKNLNFIAIVFFILGLALMMGVLGAFIYNAVIVNPNPIRGKKTVDVSPYNIGIDNNLTAERESTASILSDRQVYYAGLEDCTVGPDSIVYLENLKENNDIYMAYRISVDGVVIHETGLIPAGEFSKWTPSDVLNPGQYELSIRNIPYYDTGNENYEQLAYQPVNIINMTVIE